ncbi:Multiple sugar ABC transporter, membrane-spanning permease protein MsmF [Brachybacterium faecium]|mgnify:CR=1 FL=1|uniref:Carbohydrate ABC transporter membrane protein n=1 Tax=Brachybacterium faecium (strain ATCC 43885 / DSM 4810 / JCM 11609 / LMG 19847 / NBRC 14762 / NCIMB 9860 / 6-10) TaxID=446465 RepID=C7MFF9_BRAFD|nr:sugar ABC transporter permease [Brachybacterium faecium]ACU86176.1 carbohydrate ABC transporter membrane protein [Brachybacterium faecium DSM 4810]SLM94872.1 Multiple sugar ABC transporter, membrane-spanning permease protein MsmF [Brachybacterium faecium]HJG52088.1 sugar ABC transporter permease [Brachybacterium faecium]
MMAAVPTVAPPASAAPRSRGMRTRITPSRVLFFALFLGVPMLVYVVFVVSPFLQAFYYSLTDWRGLARAPQFIGLDNYVTLFQDAIFRKALRNNIILLIVLPTVTITLAFALAILVTVGGNSRGAIRGIRGASIFRVVSFFPYVIPAVVIGILFAFIYSPNGGLLNGLLHLVGFDLDIAWLGDRRFALAAIMAAVVWSLVGFYMVLFVAAIKSIPSEVVEAARIDGAGRFRLSTSVILPMVRENVSTAAVYMGIMALDMFVYINVMTPTGGIGKSTEVVSRYLYQTAFSDSQFGLASAMGVVMALITMLMAVLVLFGTRQKKEVR